ncbi:exo-alpha-sialidase [bacterium]|nr:exo-alpha-sialidase [candidate division CSSED10-310 bacterium]
MKAGLILTLLWFPVWSGFTSPCGALGWLDNDVKITDTIGDDYQQYSAELVHIDSRTVLCVYDDARIGERRVLVAISTNGGLDFSAATEVDSTCWTGCTTMNPTIAYDPVSDLVCIVYEKVPAGSVHSEIYCAVSSNQGLNWSTPVRVNDDTFDMYDHGSPEVDFDHSNNTVHVTWEDWRNGNTDIYYANSSDGFTFSTNVKVNHTTDPTIVETAPRLDAENGMVFVAFEVSVAMNPPTDFVATSHDGGDSFQNEIAIYTGSVRQFRPDIVYDPGRLVLYVVWSDGNPGDQSVWGAASADFGISFTYSTDISDNGTNDALDPRIDRDSAGNLYVTWEDTRTGYSRIYFSGSMDGGMTFQPDKLICNGPPSTMQFTPALSVEPFSGAMMVAWLDDREDDIKLDVFGNLFIPDFHDGFADPDFSNWTSATGVASSNERSYDGDGYSCRFGMTGNRAEGDLLQAFPALQQGEVEFWFWDGYGTDPGYLSTDFRMELTYDDGGKAGVVRALGVVNATSQTHYQSYNGSAWISTGVPRSEGWHRVAVVVDATGIGMELDPVDYPSLQPVYTDGTFIGFESVEFIGGSALTPYFLDSVSITSELSETIAVPAVGGPGLVLLGLGLGVIMMLRRK